MLRRLVGSVSLAALLSLAGVTGVTAQASNPCAAKNPCAAGGKVDPKRITRPAGTKLASGNQSELLAEGERLWRDTTLSTNGASCETCHRGNASFQPTFAKPYPHAVAMATERAGLKRIQADEMVQMCLVVPMAASPLPWGSRKLAALAAYVGKVQKGYLAAGGAKPGAVNPCAAKNPCATKNPCAGSRR